MTIFCDTNILLEYLQQRQYVAEVKKILSSAIKNNDNLFISVGSFYTITYLTEKYLKCDQSLTKNDRISRLRYILNGILGTFKLCNLSGNSLSAGVNDPLFDDLEDSYQAHAAEDMNCDVFLTINDRHFIRFAEKSSVKVMTPVAFIDAYFQG